MYLRCNVHLTWCNFHLYLSFYQTRLDCRLWSTDGRRQRLRATSSSLHSGSSLHLGDTPQTPGQRSDTCYLVYLNNSKYNTKNSFNWLKCKKKKKELEIYSSFLSQINVYMYIWYIWKTGHVKCCQESTLFYKNTDPLTSSLLHKNTN